MNKQTVGIENLPNVYIERINVASNQLGPSRTQHHIKVVLMMVEDSRHKTWRNRIDNLNVKCTFVTDEKATALNSGETSLYSFSPNSTLDFTIVDSCDDFFFFREEGGYEYYKKTFEARFINPTNLNVYAATYVDDLGFGIELFDKFYGPMVGESIFVAGQINKDSGYFYYPETNEEYGGPVHTHNQGYMEGSEHTDKPHSEVVYVPEENFKITSMQEIDFGIITGLNFEDESVDSPSPGTFVTPDGIPIPTQNNPDLTIEDPNVPSGPLTEIY